MNWGNKLIIVFIVFAALMSTLVYKSINTKFDLVSKDYYKDELRYQDKIDGMNNAAKVSDVIITQDHDNISIEFPKELKGFKANGESWFYCATDEQKDKKIAINLNENGSQIIPKSQFAKANYLVKISWKVGDRFYFSEKKLTIK